MGTRLNSHYFVLIFSLFVAMGTSACFDKKVAIKPRGPSSGSGPSSSGFSGATSAQNLAADGLAIQVNWTVAQAPYVHYTIYSVAADGSMSPLKTKIPLSQSSYTQTGLTSGVLYSYAVQAFKADGSSDGNTNVASALAYAGIKKVGGATAVSLNSAYIHFTAGGTNTQGVTITCSNAAGTATATASVYNSAAIIHQLTGLYSGTTYACRVNAIYQTYWGTTITDSNATTFSFQTISQSYTQTTPAYQGVILVQAFGDAPTAPTAATAPAPVPSPAAVLSTRQVNLTWKNFSVSLPLQAQYRVVRVRQGGVLNMNTNATCTSTTVTSCQVCVSTLPTNPYSRTCSDTVLTLGKSPNRYDYAVSLIVNPDSNPPLAEEMPTLSSDAPFRILVPVPPDNMVLIHRDSVNYEICTYMNRTPDPLNNQRCAYTGLGSIPYGTGAFGSTAQLILKGKSGTPYDGVVNSGDFYDFGYNLFYDRWEAACNWTPSAASATGGTGMCGAGATSGNCFGSGPPLASIGVNGNVYFDVVGAVCYSKLNGSWDNMLYTISTVPLSVLRNMITTIPDPIIQKPVSTWYQGPGMSSRICQSKIDPNYGPKRLPSRREFVASAGFQWMPGEPGQMTSSQIYTLQQGSSLPTNLGCNTSFRSGVGAPGVLNNPNESVPGPASSMMIGSHYTAKCVSRFGAQDLIGNATEYLTDSFYCHPTNHTCNGVTRDYTFTQQYNLDGLASNTGPGGTAHGQVAPNYTIGWRLNQQSFGSTFFSIPMGMPFIANDNGNAIPASSVRYEDSFTPLYPYTERYLGSYPPLFAGGSWNPNIPVYNPGGMIASRFSFFQYLDGNQWYGYRCTLPAE